MATTKNTFYHGDCLFVLTHDVPAESVDLIYLDPPFFTGQVQKGTKKWQPGAMEISFEDRRAYWNKHFDAMRQKAPIWLSDIGNRRPELASYLYYMMERLRACHRVLKQTGSIYLHCDYRASHFLKIVMDDIFGLHNFKNEIAWRKLTAAKAQSKVFSNVKDSIFLYSKSGRATFHPQFTKTKEDDRTYPYIEEGTGRRYGSFDFTQKGSGPPRQFGDRTLSPPPGKHWIWDQPRINQALQQGRIIFTSSGLPRVKRYLDEKQGNYLGDLWTDSEVKPLSANAAERIGYPTQKPEALLERIIKASSNEGDLALDPFCGCGTTAIVASKLNRRFIGIDIHPTAFEVIKNRSHELFNQSRYVSRDLNEVSQMAPTEFERWANEFYSATKPSPDAGVDGITKDGIPVQTKTYLVGYDKVGQFLTDAQLHPKVPQPVKQMVIVSQTGFDDSARKRVFEIKAKFGIEIELKEPKDLLYEATPQG